METIRAPRGAALSCKGWPQEAALRMLMNNLDPEVAERPGDLVVYGGTGKAARSWDDYHTIVRELRPLDHDHTLPVQSGRAGGGWPRAGTRAGGGFPGVEIDPARVERRLATRSLDEVAPDLDTALRRVDDHRRARTPRSIAVIGNAADVYAELVRRGVTPDLV